VNDVDRKVSEPVQDALRAYLELAMGLTEASKKKAEKTVKKVAKELMGKGQATAGQLQSMAEELLETSSSNREALTRLVRVELDRALSRVGLATTDEVASLTARVDALERQSRDRAAAIGTPLKEKETPARKSAVVKKAPVATTPPTAKAFVKRATPAEDVPVATPRRMAAKAPAKKAVKKAVPATEATP